MEKAMDKAQADEAFSKVLTEPSSLAPASLAPLDLLLLHKFFELIYIFISQSFIAPGAPCVDFGLVSTLKALSLYSKFNLYIKIKEKHMWRPLNQEGTYVETFEIAALLF